VTSDNAEPSLPAFAPLALLSEPSCPAGEHRRVLQEPGFALKIARLDAMGEQRWLPPGQGQVVIPLSGGVRLQQRTAPTGADSLAAERDQRLGPADLALVPNDAHWSLCGVEAGTTVVLVSTSVARTEQQEMSLFSLARGMRLRNIRQLFANQRVTLSLCVVRPRLPLRRSLPGGKPIVRSSALLVLDGLLRGMVEHPGGGRHWQGQLATGSLIDLPRDGRHDLRAHGSRPTTALLIEPRGQALHTGKVEPFTPFVDG
jgi:hypothetical protein